MKYKVSLTKEEKEYAERIEVNPNFIIVKPARMKSPSGKIDMVLNPDSKDMVTYGVVVKAAENNELNLKQGDIIHWSNRAFMFNKYLDEEWCDEKTSVGKWGAMTQGDVLFKINEK